LCRREESGEGGGSGAGVSAAAFSIVLSPVECHCQSARGYTYLSNAISLDDGGPTFLTGGEEEPGEGGDASSREFVLRTRTSRGPLASHNQ